jgi:hypothetical protein
VYMATEGLQMRSGRKSALDEKTIKRIAVALLSGAIRSDVARRFGVSEMTLVRHGLSLAKLKGKQPKPRKKKKESRARWNYGS